MKGQQYRDWIVDNFAITGCRFAFWQLGRLKVANRLTPALLPLLLDGESGAVRAPESGYPDGMSLISVDALPAEPLEALSELARSKEELDELRRLQVAAARASGASWEQIGEALGMTRQSAWEHFAKRARSDLAATAALNTDLSEEEAMAIAVEEVRSVRRRRAQS